MPKIDTMAITPKLGSDYPYPFDLPLDGREARSVTAGTGVTDFQCKPCDRPARLLVFPTALA